MIFNNLDVEKVKSFNILILGIVFMFIFAGFNTMSAIQVMTFRRFPANVLTFCDSEGLIIGPRTSLGIAARNTKFESD